MLLHHLSLDNHHLDYMQFHLLIQLVLLVHDSVFWPAWSLLGRSVEQELGQEPHRVVLRYKFGAISQLLARFLVLFRADSDALLGLSLL